MAIRWASDRIGEQGIVGFVTNASWLDGNSEVGIRACLEKEFSSIYVMHLRGNQRTQGERSRREGGKVFGSGSRAPVAITVLVKNPNAEHEGCCIHYRDIGDYLTREEKLDVLSKAKSIKGINDWQTITPDEHHDWLGQSSEAFQQFYPLGSENARAGREDDAIFGLYSLGQATGRDLYIYNFSRDACAENTERMTQDYLNAISELEDNPEFTIDQAAQRHSHILSGMMISKTSCDEKYRRNLTIIASEESHIAHLLPRIVTLIIPSYRDNTRWSEFFQTIPVKIVLSASLAKDGKISFLS